MPTPIIVLGLSFQAPSPYAEGHVCNASEARVLNSELAENLRNNFAKRVKSVKDAQGGALGPHHLLALRGEFATYSEQYAFGSGRLTRGAMGDPLVQHALVVARSAVRQSWVKNGLDPKNDPEGYNLEVAKCASLPSVLAEAQRRTDIVRNAASRAVVEEGLPEI